MYYSLLCGLILLSLPQYGHSECSSTYSSTCTKYSQKSKSEYSGCGFLSLSRCFRHISYYQSGYSTTCDNQCPSDYGWSSWESWDSWGTCPYPSENPFRVRTRYRICGSSSNSCCYCGTPGTRENGTETEKCVHGGWKGWSEWTKAGSCSASCRTCGSTSYPQQKLYSTRLCDNPPPSNGGRFCDGPSTNYTYSNCNINYCQVDGEWGTWNLWGNWNTCSATCHLEGNSEPTQTRTRTRSCDNPAPACQGQDCPGSATSYSTRSCNNDFCAVDGYWTWESWGNWSGCSSTCETGTQTRTRLNKCTDPKHGGKPCPLEAVEGIDSRKCVSDVKCPVHGGWTTFDDWSEWSHCSLSCGGGIRKRTRSRSCTSPSPSPLNGGKDCYGLKEEVETENCNTLQCPSYCICRAWGDPHYYTPDGAVIHFQGTCKYTLWKSTPDEKCRFNVEAKNEQESLVLHIHE